MNNIRELDLPEANAEEKEDGDKGVSFRCCIYKSFIPRFTWSPKPNLRQNQNASNSKSPKSKYSNTKYKEEKDITNREGNIDVKSEDGKSIRFTIYDNGGQRVFRSIQNILLSREGIFIVVFT